MSASAAMLALAGRDLRAIARARSQVYSSVFTPLIFLVFLGTGVSRGLEPSKLPAGNYTAFLVAGVVVMTSVFSATFSSASYYRDRDSGLLRVLLASPQDPRVLLLGKSLAGVLIGVIQAMAVLALAAPFVDFEWQYGIAAGILVALAAVVLMNLFLGGVALALASRVSTMQGFHLVMNLVLFPLLFFSGAFFPTAGLPLWLEALSWANPLTYAVDALQLAAYASDPGDFIGLAIDFAVLTALAAGVQILSLGRLPRLTWSGS